MLFVLVPSVAAAEPYGPPFTANTYTAGNQYAVGVAVGANGEMAVLLSDAARSNGGYLRRYNGAGQPLNSEESFAGAAAFSVTVSGNGNYAILRYPTDGTGKIFVTLYDRSGGILVPEFRVNDTTGPGMAPCIGMNAAGQFVVGWIRGNSPGYDYFVRRYNADGSVAGPATLVHTTPYAAATMGLALDGVGNFVVTLSEFVTNNITNYDVFARRYNAAGVALGSIFRVNTFTTGWQVCSNIAMNAAGSFVITWTSKGQTASNVWTVYGQRYAASGAALGGEFQVSAESSAVQPYSNPAMASDGSFAVVWSMDNRATTPSVLPYVLARNYNSAGVAMGSAFAVSTSTDKHNTIPWLASGPDGSTFIAWREYDPVAAQMDVAARRYMPSNVTAPLLANPSQLTGLSGSAGSWQYFKVTVPSGHTILDAAIAGSIGDADLYLRYGALPTMNLWDGRPFLNGSNESAEMQNWPTGDWFIGINAYTSYSGVTLQAVSR